MNNDFANGFIKEAMTKGYTQPEAEAIFKVAARGDHFKKEMSIGKPIGQYVPPPADRHSDYVDLDAAALRFHRNSNKEMSRLSDLKKYMEGAKNRYANATSGFEEASKTNLHPSPTFQVLDKHHELPEGIKKVKGVKPPMGKQIVQHLLKHKLPYGIGAGVGLAAAGAGAYMAHGKGARMDKPSSEMLDGLKKHTSKV